MGKSPPFPSAVETFRSFLRGEGISDSIRWIWRDSIYTRRAPGSQRSWTRPIYLDERLTANLDDVERYYELGLDRGLGIALCVFCIAEDEPCCYIYIPSGETDASYRMMTSLKCQIPTSPPTALVVRHPVHRAILRWLVGVPDNSWINDVPTHAEAQF